MSLTSENKPVCFWGLHGFSGHQEDWSLLRDSFSQWETSHQWNLLTLPGHHEQSAADCSIHAHLNWLNSALSRRSDSPSTRHILIGYSMGARLALLHAIRSACKMDALVLISVNPGIRDSQERSERESADQVLANAIEANGIQSFIDTWNAKPIIQSQRNSPPSFYHTMQKRKLNLDPKGLRSSLLGFGQGVFPNLWSELSFIKVPSLLITGENDVNYTKLNQSLLPENLHFEHTIIPNTGHAPHIESAFITAEVIQSFVERSLNLS